MGLQISINPKPSWLLTKLRKMDDAWYVSINQPKPSKTRHISCRSAVSSAYLLIDSVFDGCLEHGLLTFDVFSDWNGLGDQ